MTSDTLAQELEAIDARLREMPMPFDLHPAVNDLLQFMDKAGASIIEALRGPTEDAVERLSKQLGIALEALEAIADGEGTAQVIAAQTLDSITAVGMEAIALEEMDAALRAQPSPEQTEPNATHSEMLREARELIARANRPENSPQGWLFIQCDANELAQRIDAALAKLNGSAA